jgi:diguanylate cyclase (GGDEF)-like protein
MLTRTSLDSRKNLIHSAFHEEVHRRIHYDELTGLLTMNTFLERLHGEILRLSGQHGAVFALAMTDLDGLKKVNDTHGHLCGRRVVQEMGAVIRSTLRERDRAGLYGGDEAVLLFAETSIDQASNVAEKLRVAIEALELAGPTGTYSVTISQGLAEWPTHGTTPDQLIAAADGALYAAKGAGRNCIRLAESP